MEKTHATAVLEGQQPNERAYAGAGENINKGMAEIKYYDLITTPYS